MIIIVVVVLQAPTVDLEGAKRFVQGPMLIIFISILLISNTFQILCDFTDESRSRINLH